MMASAAAALGYGALALAPGAAVLMAAFALASAFYTPIIGLLPSGRQCAAGSSR